MSSTLCVAEKQKWHERVALHRNCGIKKHMLWMEASKMKMLHSRDTKVDKTLRTE